MHQKKQPHMIRIGCTVMLLLLLTATAATATDESESPITGDKVKQDIAEAIDSIRQYSTRKQKEITRQAEKEITRLDERIRELEQRFEKEKSTMSREMQEKRESALEILRQKRLQLNDWMKKFKNSSEEAWETTREGFSRAWRDLRRLLDDTDESFEGEWI